MALQTSGTTATTVLDRAYGALGIRPQQITGEMAQIGLDLLSLTLTDLLNTATPVWCQQKILITPVQGQQQYVLPAGTHDVVRAFYRTMSNITSGATVILSGSSAQLNFGTATQVTSVAITWGAASVPVNIQTSPDGATWTTVATSSVQWQSGIIGTVWYDIDNANTDIYWRAAPVTGTISVSAIQAYNTPADVLMYRMNKDQYWNLTNKTVQGRPLQYWVDRQLTPTIDVWQAPDSLAAQNVIPLWRARIIQDVGTLQQAVEVPVRWFWTVIIKLAAKLAFSTPEADPNRIQMVQAEEAKLNQITWNEERDKSPVQFQVNLGAYTR
jgi:hypothetical protein